MCRKKPHLYTYLTGPEYLQLIGRLRNIPEALLNEKIDRFLELLGIYDDRYQTLSSYSKGMRQKILIAAAVLHNPRIVILDEPFSGLDVTAARVLKAFVRSLAAEGKMVVFSSHVLEVVEQVCSRVVILKDGHIVGHDSVDNLRNTLKLPSLDAVFATLVEEDNVEKRTNALHCGHAPAMIAGDTPFKILWRVFRRAIRRERIGDVRHADAARDHRRHHLPRHARPLPHDEDDVRLRDDGDGGQA